MRESLRGRFLQKEPSQGFRLLRLYNSFMRVWDLPPEGLCRKHLLGEHREIHAIWSVLTNGRSGYSRHPETLRWKGRLGALYERHRLVAAEMARRGYNHASPLDKTLATGKTSQTTFIHTPREQKKIINAKNCDCRF